MRSRPRLARIWCDFRKSGEEGGKIGSTGTGLGRFVFGVVLNFGGGKKHEPSVIGLVKNQSYYGP